MPQIGYLPFEKFTLPGLQFQACFCWFFKYRSQSGHMFFRCLQKNNNVIQVYNAPLEMELPKTGLHNPLEHGRYISQLKCHPFTLLEPQRSCC